MNKKVAIIGFGWVGKAMKELFPDALIYSRDKDFDGEEIIEWVSSKDLFRTEINKADIAFICVPTPNLYSLAEQTDVNWVSKYNGEGTLDTSAVEECIDWLETPLIVVRSTVNPGDCEKWSKQYNKRIVFQPEYLGETPAHPLLDTTQANFLILGGKKRDTRELIELYTTVYNANTKIRQVSLIEAEIIKLTENRAIAFKVAQCQELYDVCERAMVDYYTIRDAVYGYDPRFDLWWTFIYLGNRGFNSKCIPKDVYAWCAWAESLGYEPKITRSILEKNKEWINA